MDCNEKQFYLDDKVKELNETLIVHLENKNTDFNKTLTVHLENKVKELHTNVRHITQLTMTWFAFFVTINYLTMGWLAKGSRGSEGVDAHIVYTVAAVFIVQNVLGIIGVCKVRDTAQAGAAQVGIYENWLLSIYKNWLGKTNSESHVKVLGYPSISTKLYASITWSLQIVLLSLIGAWGFILGYYIYLNL